MILLDTNVLSEMMRPSPSPIVSEWLDQYPHDQLWISVVTVAELGLGVAQLPEGRRKRELAELTDRYIDRFSQACVSFDPLAARQYPAIVVGREAAGRPISTEDALIAAIAVTTGLTLATRNVKDFEGIEVMKLIDPWLEA